MMNLMKRESVTQAIFDSMKKRRAPGVSSGMSVEMEFNKPELDATAALNTASEAILSAIELKDAKALTKALKSMFMILEAEEDAEEDSEEETSLED